jgi:hypothetical protein
MGVVTWKRMEGTLFKNWKIAGCRWLIQVILAIQETEIRRITVQSQPRQNSSQDPSSRKKRAVSQKTLDHKNPKIKRTGNWGACHLRPGTSLSKEEPTAGWSHRQFLPT